MKDTILSVIRHSFTFGGGFLASYLHISGTTTESVGAALLALVGVVWGAVDEYLAANKK